MIKRAILLVAIINIVREKANQPRATSKYYNFITYDLTQTTNQKYRLINEN